MFDIDSFSKTLQNISDSYDSITEFAEKSGVNRTYLSKYINKNLDTPPSPKILEKISNTSNNTSYYDLLIMCGYLDKEDYSKDFSNSIVSSNSTVEYIDNINTRKYYMCPVYGQISVDQCDLSEESIEGRIPIDSTLFHIDNPEELFFLRISDESMNKLIHTGSYALIHKQNIVENGEIAVILVDEHIFTLKKFTRRGDIVVLEPMSNDTTYQTQIYNKNTSIKILGKYIGKFEIND